MEKEEYLYELLDKKVKENMENKRKLMKIQKQAQDYANIKVRYYDVTSEIKAYFYYKYFMENIFYVYLKEQISTIKDTDINKAKDRLFRLDIHVSGHTRRDVDIQKFAQAVYISFKKPLVWKYFNEYMEGFSQSLGVDNEDFSDRNVFGFEKVTIKDILEAYYLELKRFKYIDALIDSVQEEENTHLNEEEVIKGIKI